MSRFAELRIAEGETSARLAETTHIRFRSPACVKISVMLHLPHMSIHAPMSKSLTGPVRPGSKMALLTARSSAASKVWPGVLVYLISLTGTLLLKVDQARFYAVALLFVAATLAVIIWGHLCWTAIFVADVLPTNRRYWESRYLWSWAGIGGSGLLIMVADIYQAANPSEVFGPAGWLWLVSIGMLLASALAWARANKTPEVNQATAPKATTSVEARPVTSTLPVRRVAENGQRPHSLASCYSEHTKTCLEGVGNMGVCLYCGNCLRAQTLEPE